MSIIRTATWGATILFGFTPTDEDGNIISPPVARLHVRQGKKSVFADLVEQSGEFQYRLDTGVFKPGMLFWSADFEGAGDTKVADDGEILLTANQARAVAA